MQIVALTMAIIAILAIGMTVVILTGGIDLSVGSLIALSAVTTALMIKHLAVQNPARRGRILDLAAQEGLHALNGLHLGALG